MKTIGTFVLALAAVVAVASEKPRLDVIPLSPEKAIVALSYAEPSRFEVTVKAENGSTVYYKQVRQNNGEYRKVFDFSSLENGKYDLSFKLNGMLVKRSLEINDNAINVGGSEFRYDPFFKFDGDVLKLSYLNFDQNNLKLVFMKDREVIYESSLGREFNTVRGFDLSKLQKGKYDVVLADGTNDFYFTIEK